MQQQERDRLLVVSRMLLTTEVPVTMRWPDACHHRVTGIQICRQVCTEEKQTQTCVSVKASYNKQATLVLRGGRGPSGLAGSAECFSTPSAYSSLYIINVFRHYELHLHVQFSRTDVTQLSLHTYLRFLRAYKAKICCCVALLFDDSTAVAVAA